jgi:N-acetylglucosamine-6-phosphate deacetylase
MGMPPGDYRFGPQEDGTWIKSDGNVGFIPGEGLASSVVGMDAMLRNMAHQSSASLVDVIRMASLTPAERVGIASDFGSLEIGKQAEILVLDRNLEVKQVFVGGEEVV